MQNLQKALLQRKKYAIQSFYGLKELYFLRFIFTHIRCSFETRFPSFSWILNAKVKKGKREKIKIEEFNQKPKIVAP